MGGGSSAGMMSVRGAGDLLTRTTWILGASFFILSLLLTILAGREKGASSVVDRMKIDAARPGPAAAAEAQAAGRHRAARRPGQRARRRCRPRRPTDQQPVPRPGPRPRRRLANKRRREVGAYEPAPQKTTPGG